MKGWGMKDLRDYQKEALEKLGQSRAALLADGLGLGKTLVGVEHVKNAKTPHPSPRVLVVAPLNTHYGWQAHFYAQYPALDASPDMVRICGTPKANPKVWKEMRAKEPGVFIIGWEAMRGSGKKQDQKDLWKKTGVWDLVIADEVHRIQNPK